MGVVLLCFLHCATPSLICAWLGTVQWIGPLSVGRYSRLEWLHIYAKMHVRVMSSNWPVGNQLSLSAHVRVSGITKCRISLDYMRLQTSRPTLVIVGAIRNSHLIYWLKKVSRFVSTSCWSVSWQNIAHGQWRRNMRVIHVIITLLIWTPLFRGCDLDGWEEQWKTKVLPGSFLVTLLLLASCTLGFRTWAYQ